MTDKLNEDIVVCIKQLSREELESTLCSCLLIMTKSKEFRKFHNKVIEYIEKNSRDKTLKEQDKNGQQ